MDKLPIDPKVIKIGDWVRFYSAGRPIIATVLYPPYRDINISWKVDTDMAGGVSVESILEHRPKPI